MDKIDILNREEFVNQLVKLTENIADNKKSTSFAIDGAWGCGKSFVLDLYEEKLNQIQSEETASDKYLIIRYNCWKYDYYEEPLVAIVATILEAINEKTKVINDETKENILGVLKAVGTSFLSISNSAIKTVTGIDFKAVFDVVESGMKAGKEKFEKMKEYDGYFCFKIALHSLQQALNELGEYYTVVFLVDELDRCLPEYAIKVLERLHHLSENSCNVINVIAIDKKQLDKSVSSAFGFDDVDLYLKKFIQFTVGLNLGDISENILDKYPEYIALFDKEISAVSDSVEEFLQMIFEKIDIREQERLFKKATIAHNLLFKDKKDYSFMCMELLIVVIVSCYKDKKAFSQQLQNASTTREIDKANPPFDKSFDSKVKELSFRRIHQFGGYVKELYEYTPTDSLYSRIFCMWHTLFLQNKEYNITVKDPNLKLLLDNNIKELKRFYDTIKLIK